ncbi:MAG: serine hydrolase [Chitinophagales bacterium]
MKKIYIFSVLVLFGFYNSTGQTTKPAAAKPASTAAKPKSGGLEEIRTGGYDFINPLLDYYEKHSSTLSSHKILRTKINDYITKAIAAKNVDSVSVYYRDLVNGQWIGINENSPYSPASLLKVPYMIAALKYAQEDPDFLSKQVVFYPNGYKQPQYITDDFALVPGNLYTMSELLSAMIIHSDNEAKDIIVQSIPYSVYKEIFTDLNIDIQKYDTASNTLNFLSVKEYASFFRVLYNATFLNKRMSEYALWLLTQTAFVKGINAGVPADVKVADKFGERFIIGTNLKQLHDCGIVYKQDGPYLICIMTKGTDFKKMEKVIADISKIVYTHSNTNTTAKASNTTFN